MIIFKENYWYCQCDICKNYNEDRDGDQGQVHYERAIEIASENDWHIQTKPDIVICDECLYLLNIDIYDDEFENRPVHLTMKQLETEIKILKDLQKI